MTTTGGAADYCGDGSVVEHGHPQDEDGIPMNNAAEVSLDSLRDTYAMHTLFRRELSLAPGLVRGVADEDADRARVICEHLDLVITSLTGYHESRHDCGCLGREVPGRVTRPAEGDHARLHQVLDLVMTLARTWRASAAALDAKPLAVSIEQLALLLNDYMARLEEAILWPRTASVAS
jgi:hypothetical protein